ncbi:hypothetical protein EDB83DRAFT_2406990 [Lactarius deliciosus]|nr:hypothetical protein EDB83DRAFT_2406990 [Lactarius deliciosus]
MKQNKKIKKLISMHWAEAQLVVSCVFVAIVVVGLVSPVLMSLAPSMLSVVAIVLADIILVVAAISGGGGSGDLYVTLVLRVTTAWRRGGWGFCAAGWRWWACM